jgi:xylulokinase
MYLLGYDIGSSSIKIAIVEATTKKTIALQKFPPQEMDIIAMQPNWAEQNPDLWWDYVCEGTKAILAKANIEKSKIKAIGIAYQMHGLVCVDKNKKVIRNAIIWCDSRAVNIGNEAFEAIGELNCLTNLLNSPGNFTASKLAWVKSNEPEKYAKIYKIMLPGDFIAMKMTDEITTTISGLSEGIFWDFQKNELSKAVLNYFDFNENIFPTIKNTFEIQGKLTQNAAEKLGLPPNIPVTYRAGDQPNNALSLNVLNVGEIAATGGTSGVVYGVVDKPFFDKKSRVNGFAHVNYTVDNQRIGLLLCINGAGIQNSWLKQIAGKDLTYDEINSLAESVPVGSDNLVILPFGNGGERVFENQNIGSHISGLYFNRHTNAHLFRAGLEGIAFAFVYGINILKEMGLEINVLRVGNDNLFQSKIFAETIATLANCTIEIIETTGAIGAAKAAGVGVGIYKTVTEAVGNTCKKAGYLPDGEVGFESVRPLDDKANYEKAYEKWVGVLKNNLSIK